MGWFDGIIDTISSSVGFLVEHSGDIASAAATIAKVIGAVVADENGDTTIKEDSIMDGMTILPSLQKNLSANEKVMRGAAKILMGRSPETTDVELLLAHEFDEAKDGPTLNNVIDYTGILPNLAVVGQGQALPAIDADINRLLALNDFPTTLTAGKMTVDVGSNIGAQMCSNLTPIDPSRLPKPANLLQSPPISVGPDADGTVVKGQAIFYPIPLCGDKLGIEAYHAHVRLETSMPAAAVKSWIAKKIDQKIARTSRMERIGDIPSPYNATTVSATFQSAVTGSTTADAIMSKAVNGMDKAYTPQPWSHAGQKFIYPFQTSTEIGPAAVLQAFEEAIRTNLDGAGMPATKIETQHTVLV